MALPHSYSYMEGTVVKKVFLRLGVTMTLSQAEFDLLATSSDAAHELILGKVMQDEFKLDGETYSPANLMPSDTEFYHEDDIEFEF